MNRASKFVIVTSALCLMSVIAGCNDGKQKVAMLEESNQQLMDDLNNARAELDALRQANDECQRSLTAATGEANQLRGQLASKQEQVPAGWTAVPGGAMIAIEGSVLFDSGKARLRSGASSTLGNVAKALSGQYADKDILVFGHTDDQPIQKSGWKDNYELSAERALSVVRWLSDHGVSPSHLVACGCGEHRPRVPNTSSSNRQKNRRVEIFALDAEVKTASR